MKVMIRAPNWVGDAVMAVPALREIRRIFDKAHITMVARQWVAGLFDGEGLADELISVTDRRGVAQSISGFFRDARRLRRERFDYAVLLQNAFSAAMTAKAAGARTVVGYPTDARRALLDQVIEFEPDHKSKHQVFYYLNIASQIEEKLAGASRVDMMQEPRLRVSGEDKKRARLLLARFGIEEEARVVALNPGATNSRAKQWKSERFAGVADLLAERDGFSTIIIGTASDRQAADAVAKEMRSPARVLAGETTIAELKALLARSSLVISNDTGPAHVSAALSIPTVVIFGPTEHVATRPLSSCASVVRHAVECSPCMLRECPIDHRCMTRIETDEVYRAAKKLLGD
ncbi:MAG TPA: lipopolysaccharide heptosyltransferase II [Blastocatellia bacterium]